MVKSISYSNRTGHLLRLISKAAPLEGHIRDMTEVVSFQISNYYIPK